MSIYRGFLLFLCLSFGHLAAANVVDLQATRLEKQLAPFVGNYVQGGVHGNDQAVIVVEDGRLQWWYSMGNIPSNSFSMPLDKVGQKVVTEYRGSRGHMTVESTYSLTATEATTHEVAYGRFWMSIEKRILKIESPNAVVMTFDRKYYKRKFGLVGDWVLDTKSFDAKNNAFERTYHLLRISPKAMPLEVFFEMIRSQPSTYIRLKETTSADNIRDAIEGGEYEVVTDVDLRRESEKRERYGQVIDMQQYRTSQKCDGLLSE